jgi:hypothetical protein
MRTSLGAVALALSLTGCGAAGRPSGLPAPEYEEPKIDPWPSAATGQGGAAAAAGVVGVEPAPEAPAGPPENLGGSGATLSPGTP